MGDIGCFSKNEDDELPPYDSFTSANITPALQRLLAFWERNHQQCRRLGDLGLRRESKEKARSPKSPRSCRLRNSREAQDLIDSWQQDEVLGKTREECDLGETSAAVRRSSSSPQLNRHKFRLPKVRRQPLSQLHKLNFRGGGRMLLTEDSTPVDWTTTSLPTTPLLSRNSSFHEQCKPPAWWLDVSCPTSADMHQLQKIFPLHPLTIEDILHQDNREKTETFDRLGYYLVCFRGIDESSLKYKEDDDSDSEEEDHDNDGKNAGAEDGDFMTSVGVGAPSLRTERTVISGKQGVLSLFNRRRQNVRKKKRSKKKKLESVTKRKADSERANSENGHDRLQQQNSRRNTQTNQQSARSGVGEIDVANLYLVVFGDGIISFHFADLQKHVDKVKDRIQNLSATIGHVSSHWIAYGLMDSILDDFFPIFELIQNEADLLEDYLIDPLKPNAVLRGQSKYKSESKIKSSLRLTLTNGEKMTQFDGNPTDRLFDRAGMLNRIASNRRLVVTMSRLLAQKNQTVAALKKRIFFDEKSRRKLLQYSHSRDIHLYLGDLQDHIVNMSQGLSFYDALLSNANSAYNDILRIALGRAKHEQDISIVRLHLITLIIMPMNFIIGLHSMNIRIPSNGDGTDHLRADGSPSPYNLFGIIIVLCFLIASGMIGVVRYITKESEKRFDRKFPKLFFSKIL
ncbi:hypothetical protein BY996DRAFT_7200957 [Phakopsora pachyrhizi]|nr:hypothetical protein BY996DRAFT_7200957 [Phakopsora pachyrhizi]